MQGLEISPQSVAQVVLMSREMGRAEPELRAFIDRMDSGTQAELVALMWIGRGAFEPEDLPEAVSTAVSEATTPTADYLIGTPHLSDHLETALEAFGVDVTKAEDGLL